jgi:hypothetical protein
MYHVEGMEDHLLISSALLGNGRAKGHDDIEIRYLYMWLSYHGRVIYQRPSHFHPLPSQSTRQPWKQGNPAIIGDSNPLHRW